jgi:hypothetical protein
MKIKKNIKIESRKNKEKNVILECQKTIYISEHQNIDSNQYAMLRVMCAPTIALAAAIGPSFASAPALASASGLWCNHRLGLGLRLCTAFGFGLGLRLG